MIISGADNLVCRYHKLLMVVGQLLVTAPTVEICIQQLGRYGILSTR